MLAVAGAGLALGAVPGAGAAATRNCRMSASQAQHLGPSYIVDGRYKVRGVTCATGKRVIRAFHQCRRAHGGIKRGRCPRSASVLGFHCRERRSANSTEITGKVTCRRGGRRVSHYYTNFV